MAAIGKFELPVRLIVGDSDPIDLGTIDVTPRIEDGRVVIEATAMDSEIAALLDQSARALREGGQ